MAKMEIDNEQEKIQLSFYAFLSFFIDRRWKNFWQVFAFSRWAIYLCIFPHRKLQLKKVNRAFRPNKTGAGTTLENEKRA